MHAVSQWEKGITDLLITGQLHSFVMDERHLLNRFVLQAVKILPLYAYTYCSMNLVNTLEKY